MMNLSRINGKDIHSIEDWNDVTEDILEDFNGVKNFASYEHYLENRGRKNRLLGWGLSSKEYSTAGINSKEALPIDARLDDLEEALKTKTDLRDLIAFITVNTDTSISLGEFKNLHTVGEIIEVIQNVKNPGNEVWNENIFIALLDWDSEDNSKSIIHDFKDFNNIELFILFHTPVITHVLTETPSFKEYFFEILELNEHSIDQFVALALASKGENFIDMIGDAAQCYNKLEASTTYDSGRKNNSAAMVTFKEAHLKIYEEKDFYRDNNYKTDYAFYLLSQRLNGEAFMKFMEENYKSIEDININILALYIYENDVVQEGDFTMPLEWIMGLNDIEFKSYEDRYFDEYNRESIKNLFGQEVKDYINDVNNYIY